MTQVDEIRKNLYRIQVPLVGNPLRILNAYYIKAEDRELLIDTGFQTDSCLEALLDGLNQLGYNKDKLDVFATHIHSDHIGLAHIVKGENRTIYLSRVDFEYMRAMIYEDAEKNRRIRYVSEGFPLEWVNENSKVNDAWRYDIGWQPDEYFTGLEDGETLTIGDYTLQMLLMPGHTVGQVMLWDEEHKIMFTGDNVLFDITPNITNFERIPDSLGNYLDSLRKADTYPVELALPGHRETGDYHKRIADLLVHHEKRINQAYEIVKDNPGLNAVEITARMSWKIRAKNWDDFPIPQKWYATGECLSHLDYLMIRGKIERHLENDIWVYNVVEKN